MGALYTTAQAMNEITTTGVMGTQDPTVIPVARGKKRARNLDHALRTWLKGKSRANDFVHEMGTTGGLAVDVAPTTVHDIDEEGLSLTSGRCHRMDRLLFAGTSHLPCLAFAVWMPRSFASCRDVHTQPHHRNFSCYVPTYFATCENGSATRIVRAMSRRARSVNPRTTKSCARRTGKDNTRWNTLNTWML